MKEGKWRIVGWSLEWWEAGKGETAKLSDQKGQKWGAEIARDRGGGMKGIEEVENTAMMKYGRDPKVNRAPETLGLIFHELEFSLLEEKLCLCTEWLLSTPVNSLP